MIICKSCRTSWPDGSKFCGTCGGAFYGKRCPKGHWSPKSAQSCTRCGSADLSEFADSYTLRPLARVLAWLVFFLCLRFGWPLVCWLFVAADWVIGFIFGSKPSVIVISLIATVLPLLVIVGVFILIVPSSAKHVPTEVRAFARCLKVVWDVCIWTGKTAFGLSRAIVQSSARRSDTKEEGDFDGSV